MKKSCFSLLLTTALFPLMAVDLHFFDETVLRDAKLIRIEGDRYLISHTSGKDFYRLDEFPEATQNTILGMVPLELNVSPVTVNKELEAAMDKIANSLSGTAQLREMLNSLSDEKELSAARELLAEAVRLNTRMVNNAIKKAEKCDPDDLAALTSARNRLAWAVKNFPDAENLDAAGQMDKKLQIMCSDIHLNTAILNARDFTDINTLSEAIKNNPLSSRRIQAEKRLSQLQHQLQDSLNDPLHKKTELSGFKQICAKKWDVGKIPELTSELINFLKDLNCVDKHDERIAINWSSIPPAQAAFFRNVEECTLQLQKYAALKRQRLQKSASPAAGTLKKEHDLAKSAFDAYNRAVMLFGNLKRQK